ncbi:hypothetical protein BAUCODRAFT_126596 [Baudoinia panamericana UAMH 10762]|uniref:Uncharacterized protein n=1 Tax=Baudoinia panamericana (strain UAMH 10762) TaxID=717646 RepID=M2M4S0_BAUPA|nr:uncharacterized protein BAUCODRAFT_126596 [Baudoinia panamericana UAMH 10762]EMC91596.1 hypothetical protein BAUCODRAFT_126596 [Baudoinia panamericana UAMH 10762]
MSGIQHQGFSHGPGYSGPPPAKKPRSNPVITRYPPPPGYRGPAQPHQTFQGYGYQQPGVVTYPQQPFAAPQPYPQPQWPGYQHQQYSGTSYGGPQNYYQQTNPTFPTTYPGWQQPMSAPTNAPPQPWHPQNNGFDPSKRRHNSAPFPHGRNNSIGPLDGNGDPLPPLITVGDGDDALDEEFDGECYFGRHSDEINPELSLGVIEWRAPLPTNLPLPSSYAEAELEAIAPRKPRPLDEPSVSDYFTKENKDEALLSIRQTEEWEHVKNDLIYRDFPAVPNEIVPLSAMLEKYRYRPRLGLQRSTAEYASPGPESRSQTPAGGDESQEQNDMLGNLEQALFATNTYSRRDAKVANGVRSHSRSASVTSTATERITRPTPLAPVRDQQQEDVLAALGVTGSPKMVFQTPGPAIAATLQAQQQSSATNSRQGSLNGVPNSLKQSPPPLSVHAASNGHSIERPGSAASQRTITGSDFQDADATPNAKVNGTDNRKRSHGEFQDGSTYSQKERNDAETAEPRRKHVRVDGPHV